MKKTIEEVGIFSRCFNFVSSICQLRVSVLWAIHFHGVGFTGKKVNSALVTEISVRVVYDEVLQILLVLSVKESKLSC